MKNEKSIILCIIILCIIGILFSFAGMQLTLKIHDINKRVNEIYFTEDYLDFVKAEGRK